MQRWWQRLGSRWWIVPVAIFIGARIFSGLVLMVESDRQDALVPVPGIQVTHRVPAQPSYTGLLTNWDGQWYWKIADEGYPSQLPRTDDGGVVANVWNFYPMLPALARGLMALVPLAFPWAAACVSLLAGGAGLLILYRWIQTSSNTFNAFTAALALAMHPAAFTFQIAYAEGLAFLFLIVALRALVTRHYLLASIASVLLGLTRPVGLPLVVVIAVHGLIRWRKRAAEPFTLRDRLKVAATGVVAGASFFLWPAITGVALGDWRASQETRQAWAGGGTWVSWLSTITHDERTLAIMALVLLLVLAAVLLLPRAASWPLELRWWSGTYGLYIAAAAQATFIPIRYALLMPIPWWPIPVARNPRPAVWGAVAAAIVLIGGALQWWDIHTFYIINKHTPAPI